MTAMERIKLLSQLKTTIDQLEGSASTLKPMERIKLLSEAKLIIGLLEGGSSNAQDPMLLRIEALKTVMPLQKFETEIDALIAELRQSSDDLYAKYEAPLIEADKSRDAELLELVNAAIASSGV